MLGDGDSRLVRKYHSLNDFRDMWPHALVMPKSYHACFPDLAGEWRMSMLLFVAAVTLLSFGYVPALDE
jgi:hypothetical protein